MASIFVKKDVVLCLVTLNGRMIILKYETGRVSDNGQGEHPATSASKQITD